MKKFLLTLIALILLAIQGTAKTNEFKNILHDLNLAKVTDGTFKVILNTEIPYTDEIKIVRKSENSYYILLAETYSMVKSARGNGIIREVNVETFPYVEQNYDNGYTKVSFLTTRPIDFVINLTAKKASKFPIMDLVRLAKLEELYKGDNFDYKNAIAQNNLPKIETLIKKSEEVSKIEQQKQEVVSKDVQKKEVIVKAEPKKEVLNKTVSKAEKATVQEKTKQQTSPKVAQKTQSKKQEQASISKQSAKQVANKPKKQTESVSKNHTAVIAEQKEKPISTAVEEEKITIPVIAEPSAQSSAVEDKKSEIQQLEPKAIAKAQTKAKKSPKEIKQLLKLLSVLVLAFVLAVYLFRKYKTISNESSETKNVKYDPDIIPHKNVQVQVPEQVQENEQSQEVESTLTAESEEVSFENTLSEINSEKIEEQSLEIEQKTLETYENSENHEITLVEEAKENQEVQNSDIEATDKKINESALETVNEESKENKEETESIELIEEDTLNEETAKELKEDSLEDFIDPEAEYTPVFTPDSDLVIEQTEWLQDNIDGLDDVEDVDVQNSDMLENEVSNEDALAENEETLKVQETEIITEADSEDIEENSVDGEVETSEEVQSKSLENNEFPFLEEDNFQYIDKIDAPESTEVQSEQSSVVVLEKPEPKPEAPKAQILYKAEIANDRGLYLSEYLGNKALIGYVDNDIFILYNFRKTPIKNNEVIFRLSEARVKEDLYFVMVDDMKFLIKTDRVSFELVKKFF